MALAREGANVLLCGRSSDRLEANCKAINAEKRGRADWVWADLNEDNFVEAVKIAVADKFGGLDILVNNTGGPTPGRTTDMSPEKLDTYFLAMVSRVITLTNAFLPGMIEQRWGRVLTVASSGVFEPIPNLALSNTLRPALVGWSKTLATEVARNGITSNMLLPGSILTGRTDELDGAAAKRSGRPIEDIRAERQARDSSRPLWQRRRIRSGRRLPLQRAGKLCHGIVDSLRRRSRGLHLTRSAKRGALSSLRSRNIDRSGAALRTAASRFCFLSLL